MWRRQRARFMGVLVTACSPFVSTDSLIAMSISASLSLAMSPEPTIAALAARAVLLAASAHGVSPPELCAKVGLDPATIADVDGRVPVSVMVALWDEVAALYPDFGLHLAEMTMSAQPALPWHLVRASATLGEGIERLVAAWRVCADEYDEMPT